MLGVNLILPYCGKAVHGLLLYNRENTDSYYTVGTDVDMQAYSDRVPFSIVKHIDKVIEKCVDQSLEGSLPNHQDFGLKDGYTELLISKDYEEELSEAVKNIHQTAIEKEEAYEKQ
ncbi:ABC-type transport system, periplasmic component/surface lipoprotein [Treponema sp. JC4]|nr:ABC-type transport system, periplasmic component/surface lipoprotein [Treponema sp. JC4]